MSVSPYLNSLLFHYMFDHPAAIILLHITNRNIIRCGNMGPPDWNLLFAFPRGESVCSWPFCGLRRNSV